MTITAALLRGVSIGVCQNADFPGFFVKSQGALQEVCPAAYWIVGRRSLWH
jgi:hypothetical protein